jgi:AraC family transcriptional regulator
MDQMVEQAVWRVIAKMRENLGEPLTIDDMARTAMFSKFHFSRIFQRATGLSPGRFLSALRLEKAKQLLVSTSLNVTDISHRVGYSSVGTFSSRFTSSVGLSPTAYRRLGGFTPQIPVDESQHSAAGATVRGHIAASVEGRSGAIFVGLFAGRIPEGRPVSCTVLQRPGQYLLEKVPEGTWYLLAADSVGALGDPSFSVCRYGPITVHSGAAVTVGDLRLRPAHDLDPPVLLALLDVQAMATRETAAQRGTSTMTNSVPFHR